ncbi:MAG: reverse transcriptase domain-containing protein [Sedimenticola sp.]
MPKKNGKLRPVLDLSALNKFMVVEHFKMETAHSIRSTIEAGDWAVSIDLMDAYLHVPIRPSSRKYLRFRWQDKAYQFRVLPFGIATAPKVFTKIMEVVAAVGRRKGINLLQYFDDWLLHHQSRAILLQNLVTVWGTVTGLGLIPNLEKSELIPSQNFNYVGMNFLTVEGVVRVPLDRVQDVLNTVFRVLDKVMITAREFLSLLGTLNATANLVDLGRLHLRPLQFYLLFHWSPHRGPLEARIALSGDFKRHLRWWAVKDRFLRGVPMSFPEPDLFLTTDASKVGWGAHLEPLGLLFQGSWSQEQSLQHVNMLELMAVSLALGQALRHVQGKIVQIATDNTTVVAYLNKQGGTHSALLCYETMKLLLWCRQHSIMLRTRHITGKSNVLADYLSRSMQPVLTEWALRHDIASRVIREWGDPMVDLFATRLNAKLPLFVSPVPDASAWAVDAMSFGWGNLDAYAFPPFVLLPRLLQRVKLTQCRMTLIAPYWPQRSWFSRLLELLVAPPLILPLCPDLLSQHRGKLWHRNVHSLSLCAWRLSGIRSEVSVFQNELPSAFQVLEENQLPHVTMQSGQFLQIGAVAGKLIHATQL